MTSQWRTDEGGLVRSRRFLISGIVQGVGCRAQVERRVRELWPELRGYVKNLADGRVEVQATGDEATLVALADLLRGGLAPPVRVERVEEVEALQVDVLSLFTIRR